MRKLTDTEKKTIKDRSPYFEQCTLDGNWDDALVEELLDMILGDQTAAMSSILLS